MPAAGPDAGPPAVPDAKGHFGPYGGRFVPEALIAALDELAAAHADASADPGFTAELGRSSGAQVTLVTRSGTNKFSGSIQMA